MKELHLNEMEQAPGGIEEIRMPTEDEIRQAAIGLKNQGHDKEVVLSLLNSLFPGMKSTVQNVVDALF
jgi:hypothetical protein